MTKEQVRQLVETVTDGPCPPDSEAVAMSSLQQLEFVFGVEDSTGFRHDIPADISWSCVNDVIRWLEEKGELETGGPQA